MANPPPPHSLNLNEPDDSASLAQTSAVPADDSSFDLPGTRPKRWERLAYEPGGFAGLAFVASWAGILLAGGLLPLVIGLPLFLYNVFSQNGFSSFSISELITSTLLLLISMIAATVWTTIASSFAGTLLIMFDWSMGYILHPRTAVSLCAGLSGFIATISLSVYALSFQTSSGYLLLLLVFLSMLLFHISGMFMASLSDRRMFAPQEQSSRINQFNIRHMLVATAWAAGALAIDGLFGKLVFAKLVMFWLVMQSILLMGDWIWVKLRRGKHRVF